MARYTSSTSEAYPDEKKIKGQNSAHVRSHYTQALSAPVSCHMVVSATAKTLAQFIKHKVITTPFGALRITLKLSLKLLNSSVVL